MGRQNWGMGLQMGRSRRGVDQGAQGEDYRGEGGLL